MQASDNAPQPSPPEVSPQPVPPTTGAPPSSPTQLAATTLLTALVFALVGRPAAAHAPPPSDVASLLLLIDAGVGAAPDRASAIALLLLQHGNAGAAGGSEPPWKRRSTCAGPAAAAPLHDTMLPALPSVTSRLAMELAAQHPHHGTLHSRAAPLAAPQAALRPTAADGAVAAAAAEQRNGCKDTILLHLRVRLQHELDRVRRGEIPRAASVAELLQEAIKDVEASKRA